MASPELFVGPSEAWESAGASKRASSRRWRGSSPGGRRLALERKFRLNVEAYGGEISLLTLTAPGEDLLPFDESLCKVSEPHKCSGELGCRVSAIHASIWNHTAQARASRFYEAAQRSADRMLRRLYGVERDYPRQIGNVGKVWQLRGVSHFHWAQPGRSELEKIWTRHIKRFMEAAHQRELALGADVRWAALEREYMTGEATPGVYGFGFTHPGRRRRSSDKAAKYLAKNAAGYMANNVHLGGGRHYVSSRLTARTGVTMRVLRDLNYLYIRRKLIAAGELADAVMPSWWDASRCDHALRIEALLPSLARAP